MDNETLKEIRTEIYEIEKVGTFTISTNLALAFLNRIEESCDTETKKLHHWIRSAARWIKCHDIYHHIGQDLLEEAKKILNDDGEFLFKKGDQ